MFFALLAHNATVIPVEVVEIGGIVMGFCRGVGCAACIISPWRALEKGNQNHFMDLELKKMFFHQAPWGLNQDKKGNVSDSAMFAIITCWYSCPSGPGSVL